MQGNAYTPCARCLWDDIQLKVCITWQWPHHMHTGHKTVSWLQCCDSANHWSADYTCGLYVGHCILWTPDWTNQLNNLPWRSYWDSNMCVFMHVGHICWPFWPCDNHRPVYINKVTTSMQWVEAAEAKKWFTAHYLVTVVTTHTGCLALCGNLNNNDWFGVSALQRVQSPTRVV